MAIQQHLHNWRQPVVPGKQLHPLWSAVAVGLLYLVISVLWIVFSDRLAVELAPGQAELILIQKYKGLGFVAIMSLLITWLVYTILRRGRVLEHTLHLVRTDPLTGLSNRGVAENYLTARLLDPAEDSWPCGILLFDIRGLHRVNYSVGRSGGDRLLKEVGRRIRHLVRQSDLVARLEGDRFIVVLGSLEGEAEALGIATKILMAFDRPIVLDGMEFHTELRGGMALARRDGTTPFELLDAAERALFRSKKNSHALEIANRQDLASNAGYLEQENRLRKAIRERQFTIALQPQVDLDTFELVGAEVLARWQCPGRGEVSPGEFIPLAESLGLIQEITEQVFAELGNAVHEWYMGNDRLPRFCVNLSGLDLKSGRIINIVDSFLARSKLPGHHLTLEITESWLMEDPNLALGLVHRLREMDARIAIDDFGTGYSALGQLVDFPFDYVKFDRLFVSGIDRLPKKAKVLTAIQRMAMTLGARTIAEGVETVSELELLEQLGLDEAQGYLFSRPVATDTFASHYLRPESPPFRRFQDMLHKRTAGNRHRATRISGKRAQ